MLIEFGVSNFKSIRDEARLSMVAGTGKEHEKFPPVGTKSNREGSTQSSRAYGCDLRCQCRGQNQSP